MKETSSRKPKILLKKFNNLNTNNNLMKLSQIIFQISLVSLLVLSLKVDRVLAKTESTRISNRLQSMHQYKSMFGPTSRRSSYLKSHSPKNVSIVVEQFADATCSPTICPNSSKCTKCANKCNNKCSKGKEGSKKCFSCLEKCGQKCHKKKSLRKTGKKAL